MNPKLANGIAQSLVAGAIVLGLAGLLVATRGPSEFALMGGVMFLTGVLLQALLWGARDGRSMFTPKAEPSDGRVRSIRSPHAPEAGTPARLRESRQG